MGEMETWYLLGGPVTAYEAAKRQPSIAVANRLAGTQY